MDMFNGVVGRRVCHISNILEEGRCVGDEMLENNMRCEGG